MSQPLPGFKGDQTTLLEHLSSTIGADVERAMDAVGWEHTASAPTVPPDNPETTQAQSTPPTADPTANPVVSPASATKDASPTDWEQFREANGLILGKYADAAAAAKGMHSLLHMAKSALSERDAAKTEADQLRHRLTTPPVVRDAPVSDVQEIERSPKLQQVLAKARGEDGLSSEDLPLLIEGIEEQVELKTRRAAKEQRSVTDAEDRDWLNVDQYMTQNHPNSMKFADEMILYKNSTPEVGSLYDRLLKLGGDNAKRDATVYMWNEFSRANPHVLSTPVDAATEAEERKLQANAAVRKEEVEDARKHAGLLGTGASGAHEASAATGSTQADIDAAAQMMKQSGHGQLWRSMTIAKDLKGPLFDE